MFGTHMTSDSKSSMHPSFQHQFYHVRKKILTFLGAEFHIFDSQDRLVFYTKQKAFKLKEDIRIYTSEDMREEVLVITARQILDFSAVYDVRDPITGEHVGSLQRKGMKSLLKDEWIFMDAQDRPIGLIKEDSLGMALLRRFLTNLVPQTYFGSIGEKQVCMFKQNFNPFVIKINLDFSMNLEGLLDKRLGVAAAVLLCAIEGRQK
jgi:hypothetical protein